MKKSEEFIQPSPIKGWEGENATQNKQVDAKHGKVKEREKIGRQGNFDDLP
jgi:hypothetical protein